MSKPVIQVENLSKAYQLGQIGTGTITQDLERFWITKILGKEDPFLRIGETNDRATKGESNIVWSLKDLNFTINQGDAVGIIGKNGAGKSTLLKLLSRVTAPTTGQIKVKGRIASLLEVGTGFHPELSGRENIYLNGAILGMRKKEIDRKFDEIVDFSGVERYIDTPVKRYSSGMYVRLAFAVAAHLESEILIVDEVLAVGDAEFQKKCLGKMGDLSKGEGRTVLFVSHNMASVQSLCTSAIVLKQGYINFEGVTEDAINNYLKAFGRESESLTFPLILKDLIIEDFSILDRFDEKAFTLILGSTYNFQLKFKNNGIVSEFNIRLQIFDANENLITTLNTYHTNNSFVAENDKLYTLSCFIDKFNFALGKYFVGIEIMNLDSKVILYSNDKLYSFHSEIGDFYGTGKLPSSKNIGKVMTNYSWKIN